MESYVTPFIKAPKASRKLPAKLNNQIKTGIAINTMLIRFTIKYFFHLFLANIFCTFCRGAWDENPKLIPELDTTSTSFECSSWLNIDADHKTIGFIVYYFSYQCSSISQFGIPSNLGKSNSHPQIVLSTIFYKSIITEHKTIHSQRRYNACV
jgi:hypothetical protein